MHIRNMPLIARFQAWGPRKQELDFKLQLEATLQTVRLCVLKPTCFSKNISNVRPLKCPNEAGLATLMGI